MKIETQEDYIALLATKKSFIMQHLLKLFYYWNYKEVDYLANPKWTRKHWLDEIVDIYDISSYDFGAIDSIYDDDLFDALYIEPNYDVHIEYIKELMVDKGNSIKPLHKLPIISDRVLKRKWKPFCVAYYRFIQTMHNRLLYENSKISRKQIYKFWESMAKKCSTNEKTMENVSEKYANFSELTQRLLKIIEENKR